MNTLLTTTALLYMQIHSLPRVRFRTVSAVTAEKHMQPSYLFIAFWSLIVIKLHRDSGLYPNLIPLEIIIKTFLYNSSLFITLNLIK